MFMLRIRNLKILSLVLPLLLFLVSCATEEAAVRSEGSAGVLDLEFLGGRVDLRNPMPRNGEEVEVTVIVRNRGDTVAKRVPVHFLDNLRVFSTEEIDLEPGGQRRLSARWRATIGNHTISVVLDPSHHFKELKREKSEVSAAVLVR
jgi:hypothetical protein